ncbi:hypothetical protein ACFL59_05855 [Planctomycetota bacterium]
MHKVLADARFYSVLLDIDRELASHARDAGCRCGGRLHVSDYPRRPRGGPPGLPPGYEKRFSFCCAVMGCRQRATPASVRFLGRRWYLGAVVVIVSMLRQGASQRRLASLREWLGEAVSRQTIERWRRWWREAFSESSHWRASRGRFMPPVVEASLPLSVLERFYGDERGRLTAFLRFLGPVTTGSGARSPTGGSRR